MQEAKTISYLSGPFFIDDKFYMEMCDYLDDMDLDDDEIKNLPEDWNEEIELAAEEPIFNPNKDFIDRIAEKCIDWYDDRFPEDDYDGRVHLKMKNAIESSIDLNKLKSELPVLYYPNKTKIMITKQDLLDSI